MIWPFSKPKRKAKDEALTVVIAEQKAAAERLRDNLRKAHTKNINAVLMASLPRHEGG